MVWTPVSTFLFLAAALGFVLDLGKVRSRVVSWLLRDDVKLQFTAIEPLLRIGPHNVPRAVQVHVTLENPNDVSLRVEPEYLRTTFENVCSDVLPRGPQVFDIAPKARDTVVRGQMIGLAPPHIPRVIVGRIEWKLNYDAVRPGRRPDLTKHSMLIKGSMEIEEIDREHVVRWVPELGSELLAVEEGNVWKRTPDGDIWIREGGSRKISDVRLNLKRPL